MCLAIPGKVQSLSDDPLKTARVSFGGVVKEISLIYLPDVQVGDYVIAHVGFAISKLNEVEALRVFEYFNTVNAMDMENRERPP
jgi:hydrogenase expression/formation protein HypC